MQNYEVEIKVLLGTEEAKNTFIDTVKDKYPSVEYKYSESQKNHYFE